ncbi:ATP-binding protein [Celeribacter halophilus]|uniref:Predicted ATP-dependent endonuclease of the OLD family, contains P-loop ATPase and TOPRIM domains n=1 Tax=Celeribacter halophilus TaxID=576117 RepID=A0A1I3RSY7_9RHOB|nr:ATP-binding protein [Celeribacter halophilus]PZX12739.1 putative ATP-dependent endonuclease of OLD family [Celeribacter halophilus]SFJ49022.1 Predicted ATP-dependent endonuclease of the OLD family, contains P-loop ATPase and TOPRIM domains [Celeribacter halophilus]
MQLVTFEIVGFRGYRELRKVSLKNLTTFVGKNDAGKSSLMDALDLFFDDSKKLDREDLCVDPNIDTVALTAEFLEFPTELVLDAAAATALNSEHLLFQKEDGQRVLRVVKEYKPGKAADVFVEATAPLLEQGHPILLKQADLRKLGRELGLEESIPAADRVKNPPWRNAIFQHFADAAHGTVKIPIAKDDAKKIWDQIKPHIPYFCLFKVDRASSDQDGEARDPLAVAAKIAIGEREAEINAIVEQVQVRANELVERTLHKLQEMAPELAVGLSPDVSGQPKWDSFKTTLKTEGNIPFNKRGSGTKRLVLLNFFRAEAERRSEEDGRGVIYAFEEPESSQHPSNQRLLLDSFKRLAEGNSAQVLLTTHSPLVAQNLPAVSLRLITKEAQGACPTIEEVSDEGEAELLLKIADELGVLPDNRVRVLVMVEGPNDVNFFENIFTAVSGIDPTVLDIASSPQVALVPMGGADLKHWITRQYLQGFGCVEYHIYDRDCGAEEVAAYQAYVDQVNDADNANTARLTSKRETENYLSSIAIFNELTIEVDVDDQTNVPLAVSQASKLTELAPDMGQGSAKRILNTKVAAGMTAEMLSERDGDGDVVGWFREITAIVQANEN